MRKKVNYSEWFESSRVRKFESSSSREFADFRNLVFVLSFIHTSPVLLIFVSFSLFPIVNNAIHLSVSAIILSSNCSLITSLGFQRNSHADTLHEVQAHLLFSKILAIFWTSFPIPSSSNFSFQCCISFTFAGSLVVGLSSAKHSLQNNKRQPGLS